MHPSADTSTSPPNRPWSTRVARFLALLIVCATIGILSGVENYYTDRALGEVATWTGTLLLQVVHWTLWGCFLPIVVAISRRASRINSVPAQVGVHLAFGTTVSLAHSAVAFGVRSVVMPQTIHGQFSLFARGWFLFNLVTYAALVGATLAVEHRRRSQTLQLRTAQLDVELSRAELRALQMQLHPHFLFNTLNTVAMLIRTSDGPRALTMIAGLGDLLRQMLDKHAAHEVPLREELAFLDHYLGIERVRFHDRLRVEMDVEPSTLEGHVPRFVLQPLVENAIRHGIEKRSASGTLTIAGRRRDGVLAIEVRDDGRGLGAGPTPGVGLANTRERLRHLYGRDADLSLVSAPGGGAIATIIVPWHTQPLVDSDGVA